MILATDVTDSQGRMLLSAGTILKEENIRLMDRHGITQIWAISDAKNTNRQLSLVPSLMDVANRIRLLNQIQAAFSEERLLFHQVPQLEDTMKQTVDELMSQPDALLFLSDINHKSEYLFVHSLNVGLFAVAIGLAMGLSKEDTVFLGVGGLLHDLGKTFITKEIIDKKGPLTCTEFEQIKGHAEFGYSMLRRIPDINHQILLAVLQHHERYDGRGYPRGLSGEDIYRLARIVSVADMYDALTSDRVYRNRMSLLDAVNMINQVSGLQFDPAVVAAFNTVVVPYIIGNTVMLSNTQQAIVMKINTANLFRPVVWTKKGIINLLEESTLSITQVV